MRYIILPHAKYLSFLHKILVHLQDFKVLKNYQLVCANKYAIELCEKKCLKYNNLFRLVNSHSKHSFKLATFVFHLPLCLLRTEAGGHQCQYKILFQ